MTTQNNCFRLHEKNCLRLLVVTLILFYSPFFIHAQSAAEKGLPFVTNFSAKDYHGNVQNWSIAEDKRGLLYFGNATYIMQYDGVKWRKITTRPAGSYGSVRSMALNKRGNIYYTGVSDFGYLSMDDSLGEMKAHSLLKYIPEPLREFSEMKTVLITNDGYVYFQSRERLFRFKEDSSGKIIEGSLKNWEPKSKFMYAFYVDGDYFVHQQNLGLYKMDHDSLELIPGSEFLGKERMQVFVHYPPDKDNNKQYIAGLFYSGLYLFNGKTFTSFKTESDSILHATLYAGALLKDGAYAFSTAGKGLVIIDKNGKTLQVVNRRSGLQDESIYALYPDEKGNIWLALDNGISRVQTSSPFTQFNAQSGIKTQVLAIDRFEGTLYLGTTNGPLRFNSSKGLFEHIDEVGSNQVFAFVNDHDQMLIATDGLYAVKKNKVRLVSASVGGNLQLSCLFIPTKYPNLLIGGDAINGMAVFERKNASDKWKHTGYFPGITQQIWFFAEDKDGEIWAGTQNNIVYKIIPVLDKDGFVDLKKSHTEALGTENGLGTGSGYVVTIHGEVFFPCDSLIYRYDKQKNHFYPDKTFGTLRLGSHDESTAIAEDKTGKVWIQYGKKTMVAIPRSNETYELDTTSLLPISDKFISQFFPDENGIVWISNTEGVIRYAQNMQKSYGQTFPIYVRHIIAGDKAINPDLHDNGDGKKVSIDYKDNNLRFEYAAPFFEQEDKTQYQTWLEGFDKTWSDWGNNSYKEYTNLSEGSYHFHVRAKNVYQITSEEAVYAFTVKPPLTRTWWMYLLYALAALLVIYFIIRYRTKKLHEQRMQLEKIVQERTHEVQVQAEELTTVNQISQALASQLNLDDLIKLVGDEMRQVFKANIVYLAMLDKKTNTIHFPYQYGEVLPPIKFGEGIASKILATGKPLLINKDLNQQISQLGIQRLGLPSASYLGVPIPIDDEIIGVLSVQSTTTENYFDEKDQRLLSTIAANVGVALKKARLFEEIKHAKMEAEESSKIAERANAAKSAFLSTVSHELRTPLTSVLGFAKIIKKRLEERIFPATDKTDPKTEKAIGQVSENLNVVISEGERLTHLINDVLDLAKIEAGKMEWNIENVSISEIVDRAIAATSSLFFQKNIKLEKNIEPDLPNISGDHDKLIQVVVNLISNAVKFTEQGSITCTVIRKNGEIITSVKDTGIGIAKQDQDAVFEQFKQLGGDTLTDKPKGTGLGLPICKEIVEHHGGHIWLESEPGKGSVFSFALPVVAAPAVTKPIHLDELVKQLRAQMAQSKFNTKDGNATILIVDDEDSIRSLLHQEFSDAGYLVEEATNGKEALTIIRNHRPDLIVLDVMMPEMNGFDVAAILKNDPQTMDIPIIVLSIVQDKARGYRIGVDRYLTKPIDTAKLFSEVGTLLEQGKSKKKVMVVDEDAAAVKTLTDVLQAKGYQVVESDGKELVEKAIASQPDIIILNSVFSGKQEIVQTLRFEKGLENVLFLIYQ
ncbi:MAG: response regulator [Bacteroidetes bacterium]|nr:response regulator [Bacteroidota bacterium]